MDVVLGELDGLPVFARRLCGSVYSLYRRALSEVEPSPWGPTTQTPGGPNALAPRCESTAVQRRAAVAVRGRHEAGEAGKAEGTEETPGKLCVPRLTPHLGPADLSPSGLQPCEAASTRAWRFTRAAPRKAAARGAAPSPDSVALSPQPAPGPAAAPSEALPNRAPRRKRDCWALVGKPKAVEGDAIPCTAGSRNSRPLDGVAAPPPSPALDANSARVLRRGVSCMTGGGGGAQSEGDGAHRLPRCRIHRCAVALHGSYYRSASRESLASYTAH